MNRIIFIPFLIFLFCLFLIYVFGCDLISDDSDFDNLENLQIFPPDNSWNTDISDYPVHPNSDNFIASIGLEEGIHPDFGTVWEGAPNGIPYIVVPGTQPMVPVTFKAYADESDPGPYPIPEDAPIEGGPESIGDRHVIVIDKDNLMLYELYRAFKVLTGWEADSGAKWDLTSNNVRPKYWTSADAAGLPIFPGLIRYDEVLKGEIDHALRFTVSRTQRGFIYPARHFASISNNPNLPPMGLRLRLKSDFNISGFSSKNQNILKALKRYGMLVADNGSNWFISGAPDSRWDDDDLSQLKKVKGKYFEVVYTGEIEN
jgi:hypothetical protein